MSSGIPPTYYFNGITFNPSFYQSDENYLTVKAARSSFLTYPMSQGDELFASNLTIQSTLTDSAGSKGTSGQILSSTETGVEWVAGGGSIVGNLDIAPPFKVLTDTITQSDSHVSGSDISLYGTSTDSDILIGSLSPPLKVPGTQLSPLAWQWAHSSGHQPSHPSAFPRRQCARGQK